MHLKSGSLPCTGTDQPFNGTIAELLYSLPACSESDASLWHTVVFQVIQEFTSVFCSCLNDSYCSYSGAKFPFEEHVSI